MAAIHYALAGYTGGWVIEQQCIDMSFLRAVAAHPWATFCDLLLIGLVLLGATIVALEYELFEHVDELTSRVRRISIGELMVLSGLMLTGIVAFIARRARDSQHDAATALQRDLDVQRLRDEAARDPLTELPNRRGLLSALAAATDGRTQDGRQHALFLLDLDNFKRVNDQEGHAAGDRVLRVVVERFKSAARPTDFLARLGGDEFAVIAYDVDRSAAATIGARLVACLHTPIAAERAHQVGVSVGVCLIPQDGITSDEILAYADAAMYQAKAEGGSDLAFFKPEARRPQLVGRSST
jgi:diguanylate cyclase (GGDEF)-like protein